MEITRIEDWEPFRNADQLRELMPAWHSRLQNGWDGKTRDGIDALRLFGKYRSALMETAMNARIWGLDPTPFYQLVEIDQNLSHPDFQQIWLKVGNLAMKCRVEANAHWQMSQNENASNITPSREPNDEDSLKPKDKALAFLCAHPDWTDKRIAAAAGISAGNLSRNTVYKSVREQLRRNFYRRGYRDSKTGNLEATTDE